MSKSPWMSSSFCAFVAFGGSGPNCASPGILELRTMAGPPPGAAEVVAAVALVDVADVAEVALDAVVAVLSAVTGVSFLHATASASRAMVASLFMSPHSRIKRGTRGRAAPGWADRRRRG